MSLSQYLLIGAAALGALALGAAYFGQRRLIYFPDRVRMPPAEVGLAGVEERVLKTPDGARVVAWYGKAQPGQPTHPLLPWQRRQPGQPRARASSASWARAGAST